jgi:hypothetical protein
VVADEQQHTPEGPGDDEPPVFTDFGDYVRHMTVLHTTLADSFGEGRQRVEQMIADVGGINDANRELFGPMETVLAGFDELTQRMKLMASLNAAQAIAWDHLQAAGGVDDPEAYADYVAASQLHTALASEGLLELGPPDDQQ